MAAKDDEDAFQYVLLDLSSMPLSSPDDGESIEPKNGSVGARKPSTQRRRDGDGQMDAEALDVTKLAFERLGSSQPVVVYDGVRYAAEVGKEIGTVMYFGVDAKRKRRQRKGRKGKRKAAAGEDAQDAQPAAELIGTGVFTVTVKAPEPKRSRRS
eukprot:TRINITY_DN114378_c0_g1_i1.p2 TRINITY_DN114378_c0_g1~~TRINITY_DN114378_c0_g1_i1.p2  ORF type:complete len:155 (+),score=51.41 TRINITY_DN114378_c0_g1_i1:48-512(+)